jgi:hypothetical protein
LAVFEVILLFLVLVNAQNGQPNFITHNSVKFAVFLFFTSISGNGWLLDLAGISLQSVSNR